MNIQPMQSEQFDPNTNGNNKPFLNLLGIGVIVFLALVLGAKILNWGYGKVQTVPATVPQLVQAAAPNISASVQRLAGNAQAAKAETRIVNGVTVTECTAVTTECGDMTPGQKADYGTGFHVSADGHNRANPPAGWKWQGDLSAECKAKGLRLYEVLSADGTQHAGWQCGK